MRRNKALLRLPPNSYRQCADHVDQLKVIAFQGDGARAILQAAREEGFGAKNTIVSKGGSPQKRRQRGLGPSMYLQDLKGFLAKAADGCHGLQVEAQAILPAFGPDAVQAVVDVVQQGFGGVSVQQVLAEELLVTSTLGPARSAYAHQGPSSWGGGERSRCKARCGILEGMPLLT